MALTDNFDLVPGTVDNPLPSSPFERGTIEDWNYRTLQRYRDTVDNDTPEERAQRLACQEELKRKRAASELSNIGLQICDDNSHGVFPVVVNRPSGQHEMRTKPLQADKVHSAISSPTTPSNTSSMVESLHSETHVGERRNPSFEIGSPPARGLPQPRIPDSGPYGLHPRTPRETHSGRQPHSFAGIKERILENHSPGGCQDRDLFDMQNTSGITINKSSPTLGKHGENLTIGNAMSPWSPQGVQPVRSPETPTIQARQKRHVPRSADGASPPSSPPEFNVSFGVSKISNSPGLPAGMTERSKQPFSSPLQTTATRDTLNASFSSPSRMWSRNGPHSMPSTTTGPTSARQPSGDPVRYGRVSSDANNNNRGPQMDSKPDLNCERIGQPDVNHSKICSSIPTAMKAPSLASTPTPASRSLPIRYQETTHDLMTRGLATIPSYQSIGAAKTRASQEVATDQELQPAPLRINSKGYSASDPRNAPRLSNTPISSFTSGSRSVSTPSNPLSKPLSKKVSSTMLPMSVTGSFFQDKSALLGSHLIGNLPSAEEITPRTTEQIVAGPSASNETTTKSVRTTASESLIPQPASPLLQPRRQPSYSIINKLPTPTHSKSPRELLHQELQFSGGIIQSYHRKVPNQTNLSTYKTSKGEGGRPSRTTTPNEESASFSDSLKEQYDAGQRSGQREPRRTSNLDKIPTPLEISEYLQDMFIEWMYQRQKLEPAELTLSKRSKTHERNKTPTFNEAVDQIVELLRAQSSPSALSSLQTQHQQADTEFSSTGSSSRGDRTVSCSPVMWDMTGLVGEVLDPFEMIETQNMDADMQAAYDIVRVALHNTFDNRRECCTPLEAAGEVLKMMSDACDAPLGDPRTISLETSTDYGKESTENLSRRHLPRGALRLYWATAFYNREERAQNMAVNHYREDFLMNHGDQYKHLDPADVGRMLKEHGLETWRQHMADLWQARQQVIHDMVQVKMREVDRRIKAGRRWVEAIAEVAQKDEKQVLRNERFKPYAKKH